MSTLTMGILGCCGLATIVSPSPRPRQVATHAYPDAFRYPLDSLVVQVRFTQTASVVNSKEGMPAPNIAIGVVNQGFNRISYGWAKWRRIGGEAESKRI